MPSETNNPPVIWPYYVRVQFSAALNFYADYVREAKKAAMRDGAWGPWRKLSASQGEWMLGRLADIWVLKNRLREHPTAWDDGGAWTVWNYCFEVWADMDADREEGTMLTTGCSTMFRRFCRSRRSAKEQFGKDQFAEEAARFLDRLFEDEDFLYLKPASGGLLVPPSPAAARFFGIESAYYWCPIPKNVGAHELAWARDRLRTAVPR